MANEDRPVHEISGESFRRRLWKTVRRAVRHVPFIDDVLAAYYCALDANTPASVKATIAAALVYFVLPADAIPDFIVGFGFSDDLAVLTTALAVARVHIRQEHRDSAKATLESL